MLKVGAILQIQLLPNSFEAILAIRTYAVWHQDKKVGILLTMLQIAVFAVNSYSASRFVEGLKSTRPDIGGAAMLNPPSDRLYSCHRSLSWVQGLLCRGNWQHSVHQLLRLGDISDQYDFPPRLRFFSNGFSVVLVLMCIRSWQACS